MSGRICKICNQNYFGNFKDRNKICYICREEITKELPIEFNSSEFFKKEEITIIEEYENKAHSSFKEIIYKELHFFYYKCSNCDIWFRKSDHPARASFQIKDDDNFQISCSKKCQLETVHKNSTKPGNCINCGEFVQKRDAARYGIDCGCSKNHANELNYNNSKEGNCTKCGIFNSKRTTAGLGIDCGCAKNLIISIRPDNTKAGNCAICNKWFDKRTVSGLCINCQTKISIKTNLPKYCNECNKLTPHNGNICTICNPESSRAGGLLTFFTKNNKEYFVDRSSNKYILWEDFKNNFIIQNINNKIISQIQLEYNGEWFPTFITRNDPLNCGHLAFDKYLVDKGVRYFVYIKFYKDNENNIYPLVCGESASFLINSSGCDLSFSKNLKDGPSRKFLIEENFDYLYEQIYLIRTNSREESLKIEKEIIQKFNLFNS